MIRFGPQNLRIPKFEKRVFAVAGGLTDYRKRYPEKNSSELCTEAMRMAAEENDLKISAEELRRIPCSAVAASLEGNRWRCARLVVLQVGRHTILDLHDSHRTVDVDVELRPKRRR